MLKKLKDVLLYAGVGEDGYVMVKQSIIKVNRSMVRIVSGVAIVLILILLLFSRFLNEPLPNQKIHLAALVASAIVFVVSMTMTKSYPHLVRPLVYISYSVYYIYGILIGTIADPDEKTVLFMVMLVFMPMLFADRPLHIMLVTTAYTAVFICLCFCNKTGALLVSDVRNAITISFLGLSAGAIGDYYKIHGYVYQKELSVANRRLKADNLKLKDKSRSDSLTEMLGRNAYEADLEEMAARCTESLGCVYIDVNGLKHLNDTMGHDEGDKMLKFVAESIKRYFNEDIAYRIGGDEFVAFVIDPQFYEISHRVERLTSDFEENGYYASVGWQIHDLNRLSMNDLIKSAESHMYRKKVEFYKNSDFDRRTNS